MTLGAMCPNPFEVWYFGGSYTVQALANVLTVCFAGPVALCSILFLSAGTLLARFERELSHHKDDKTTDWDNYIDRIINSNDDLEREHLFYGASERGDNPVLVHRDIYDEHNHILGDSGASKTALGLAPQATQLIARGDSTVVIIDLKGDRALFEGCRREAERHGNMRFRWLSNEIGTTSFGFNPFTQSHNEYLAIEQLTQELLQGLSLDYGIQYGAGYFTAMNEIVLNSVLGAAGDRSFGELSEHLSDRDWYEQIGYKEDWKQARHLTALVKRLSASPAINVTPGMYSDRPEIHDDAIDAASLFREPQVVYLWLKSAIEPTNAPAIARLFLWTVFTAASHQPASRNRVYFFIDEMQQVLSEGIRLIFEHFRDMGGTMIGAHQTAGQLRRHGADLGDTVAACSAVKQVFRASDLDSLERLTKLSGTQRVMEPTWHQPFELGSGDLAERYVEEYAEDGLVRVGQQKRERYDREALQALSARRLSSLVRFSFDSGYTQFAGKSIAISSPYHIHFDEYLARRRQPWPTAPGAFRIEQPASLQAVAATSDGAEDLDDHDDFGSEFEMRGRNQ
ncbi:MAG: type IV secretion system DNA-binding domain-containing protein [Pirellulaceae bacterium]